MFQPIFVIKLQEKKIIRGFITAKAIDETSAKPLEQINVRKRVLFKKLLLKGIILKTDDERYYLCKSKVDEYNRKYNK